jgi:membrane protein DedA with SNARE-associated domain
VVWRPEDFINGIFTQATASHVVAFFSHHQLTHILATYGYWAIGGIVGLESMGIPLPGETILVTAAIYAGATGNLDIALVIAAAATGAIVGDNIGYWIGRRGGYPLLLKYGSRIRLNERRIKLGQYMFLRYGGAIVFFGRFIAILRVLAALLAGANRMGWLRFLAYNAAGGIIWTTIYGGAAYYFGDELHLLRRSTGLAVAGGTIIAIIIGLILLRRYETYLEVQAERALPGPLRAP